MSEEELNEAMQYNLDYTEAMLSDELFGTNEVAEVKLLASEKTIKDLQQKVEQLENIRKEAIEFMKENCDIITIDKGWIIRSELTTTGLGKLFKILNKGDNK